MRIPLAANIESRDGGVSKDPKAMNVLVESRGQDVPPLILKRPGVSDLGLVGRGTAQMLYAWNGLQAIIGDALNSGTTTTIISGLSFNTWNSSDKDSSVALSNSNLTATFSGSAGGVRATTGKSSGKWYWEVTVTSWGSPGPATIGVADSSAALTTILGNDIHGWSYNSNGNEFHNASATAYAATFTTGDVIGVALDLSAGTITFYKNGTSQGVAYSSLSGTLYPACSNGNSSALVLTANFGATAFAYSIPAGYSAFGSATSLAPTNGGSAFYAVQTNDNAATPRLFFHNRSQGWVVNRSGTISSVTFGGTMGAQTYTLNSLTRSGTTATATYSATSSAFSTGDSVTVAGASPTTYNGTFTVTGTTPGSPQTTVPLSITRSGTTATATTSNGQPHGLTNGSSYALSGATQSQYNGTFTVTVTSTTAFTFTVTVTGYSAPNGTWNASDATSGVTLLNGNLSAQLSYSLSNTHTHVYRAVRATAGLSSGKYYWEILIGVVSSSWSLRVGIANSSFPISSDTVGQDANSWGYKSNGFVYHSNSAVISGASYTNGDLIGIRLDMDNGIVSFYKNGVLQGSASGVTGTVYAIVGADIADFGSGSVSASISANFGSGSFTYDESDPATPATGTPIVTVPATSPTFTYTVSGSPTTPATGTITAQGVGGIVPGNAYVDGYFCVMDTTGVLWSSNADDPTTWGASNFLTVRNENGAGKALSKSQNYVIAWKEYSTEFYYDAQNATASPLSPVPNGFQRIGCAHGDSVARIGASHCWVSQLREGNRSVHKIEGLQISEIATPDIARIIDQDSLATVYSYGLQLKGHSLYLLTLVASNITLVYDLDSQYWTQWTSLTLNSSSKSVTSITLGTDNVTATVKATAHGFSDGDPVKIAGASQSAYNGIFQIQYVDANNFTIQVAGIPVSPATGTITATGYTESYFKFSKSTTLNGALYFLHESDGNLYQMSSSLYQDNGIPINLFTRSARVDGGDDDKKKVPTIRWIGDKVSDIGMLRYSDDDSTTFSAYRIFDLSLLKPEIRKMKAFRRRSYEFRHVGNNRIRGEALELMGISK